jgi:pentatricopeptide repeat protein
VTNFATYVFVRYSTPLPTQKLIEVDESSTGELVRLRTYLPILKKFCEIGDLASALSLFKRMQTTQGVILEPETYVLLLASMAENRYFR